MFNLKVTNAIALEIQIKNYYYIDNLYLIKGNNNYI